MMTTKEHYTIEVIIHSKDDDKLVSLYRKLIEKLVPNIHSDIRLESINIDSGYSTQWITIVFEVNADNKLNAKYMIETTVLQKIVAPLLQEHQAIITRFE